MGKDRKAWVAVIALAVSLMWSVFAFAQEAAEEMAGEISVMQVIRWGGPIGYIIIGLSFVTVALVAYALFRLRRSVLVSENARQQIATFFKERKIKQALDFCKEDASLLSSVIEAGLGRVRGGWSAMEEVMEDVGEEEGVRLQQLVGAFALIAAISPLLGLLGTVSGMIGAFNTIATSPEGAANPKMLAGEIQQALVTTFFGLTVAIPNVVAFTVFKNRLERIMIELGVVVEELMAPFKSLKPAPAPAAGAARQQAAKSAGAAAAEAEEAAESEEAPEEKPEEEKAESAEAESEEDKKSEAGEEEEAKADETMAEEASADEDDELLDEEEPSESDEEEKKDDEDKK